MKKVFIYCVITISVVSCNPSNTHLPNNTAINSPIHNVESIEDQARAAESLEYTFVRLIIYNPINTNIDGSIPLSDSAAIISNSQIEWASESEMITLSRKLSEHISIGRPEEFPIKFRDIIYVREFPPKVGSKQFNMQSYQKCFDHYLGKTLLSEAELLEECNYSTFDIEKSILTRYGDKTNGSFCEATRNGAVDELWIWVMPGAAAKSSYSTGLSLVCGGLPELFSIFVFDYGHSANDLQISLDERKGFDITPYFLPENK